MPENFRDGEPDPTQPVETRPMESSTTESQPPDLSAGQQASVEAPIADQPAASDFPPPIEPDRTRFAGSIRTFFIAVAAWIVPGSGHLAQGRFVRALAAFLAVGVMSVVGLRMHGNVYPPHGDDAFSVLGFLADASSGMFYFLAHTIDKLPPDVSRAAGDYGTRLIATAGVLNLLFVLDAMEISRGRKS